MVRTEKEKMLANQQYLNTNSELAADRDKNRKLVNQFNEKVKNGDKDAADILKKIFKKTGKKIDIEPTFHCDYGYNVELGENFFANYDCTFIDVGKIKIGDNCLLGPGVHIYSVNHSIDRKLRDEGYEIPAPVTIGDSVWIGGRSVINPGVTIGDNVIIASGSVVTKSFGSNVMIGGVPAKVIKNI